MLAARESIRCCPAMSGEFFGLSHFADYVLMIRLLRSCVPLHIDVGPCS